jgi:hypothetical protein
MQAVKPSMLWDRLPALRNELGVVFLRLEKAKQAKDHLLVEFVGRQAVTTEERGHYLELLKAEQQAYHACYEVQAKIAELLKDALVR